MSGLNDFRHERSDGLLDVEHVHSASRDHDVHGGLLGNSQGAFQHGVGIGIDEIAFACGVEHRHNTFPIFGLAAHQGKQAI